MDSTLAVVIAAGLGFNGRSEMAVGGRQGVEGQARIGMVLGIIMAGNVWFIIWPNQKIALGIDGAEGDKPKAGRTAMLFSRTNTMLSIPMLYAMTSAQNIFAS